MKTLKIFNVFRGTVKYCEAIFRRRMSSFQVVSKPIKASTTVIIHSKDKLNSSDSDSNFEVDLGSDRVPGARKLTLLYLNIPHSWKNINNNTNTIVWDELVNGLGNNASYSAANPGIFSHPLHGLSSTDTVYFGESTGTTSIDGRRTITVIDANSYSVGVDTTAGGGTASVYPDITAVSTANPGLFTTGAIHGLSIGDEITVTTTDGTPTLSSVTYIVSTVPSTTTFTATGTILTVASTTGHIEDMIATHSTTLTNQNFNSDGLATQLSTSMLADLSWPSGGITVSYSSATSSFTITMGNEDQQILLDLTDLTGTKMKRILGFSDSFSTVAQSISSDQTALVNGINTLEFHLGSYQDGIHSEAKNKKNSIFLSLPISSTYGDIMSFLPYQKVYYSFPSFYGKLALRVSCDFLNGSGRVDCPLKLPWSMSFVEESDN